MNGMLTWDNETIIPSMFVLQQNFADFWFCGMIKKTI
jgi:hypothetical protein